MAIRGFRWWRVTPEGVLTSVYHETRWEQPVLTASFVPRESYEGKIVRIVPYVKLQEEWGRPLATAAELANETSEALQRYQAQLINEIALPLQPHPFPTKLEYEYHKEGQQVGDIVPIEDPAGIYALREETPLAGPIFWDAMATGWVSLFGHIVEHEKGYRAEKALVCGPLALWHGNAELAQRVASRYQCEVEVKEAAENQTWATITWPKNLGGVVYGTGQADSGV